MLHAYINSSAAQEKPYSAGNSSVWLFSSGLTRTQQMLVLASGLQTDVEVAQPNEFWHHHNCAQLHQGATKGHSLFWMSPLPQMLQRGCAFSASTITGFVLPGCNRGNHRATTAFVVQPLFALSPFAGSDLPSSHTVSLCRLILHGCSQHVSTTLSFCCKS